MAIRKEQLESHIADYNRTFSTKTNRFVCPILGRECEPSELMNGHILNERLEHVPIETIIQFKDIDHFYGSNTESAFIRFLQRPFKDELKVFREEAKGIMVTMADGTEIEAFYTEGNAADAAMKKYPCLIYPLDEQISQKMYLKTSRDDPRLKDPRNSDPSKVKVRFYFQDCPSHWVASGWKAAYLMDFRLRGYTAMADPNRRLVRERLRAYFLSNGAAKDAPKYFGEFENAIKPLGEMKDGEYHPLGNTLADGRILFHYSPDNLVFAASYLFPYRNITYCLTVPQGVSSEYGLLAMECFTQFMRDDPPSAHYFGYARWNSNAWVEEGQKFLAQFPAVLPPSDFLEAMNTAVERTPPNA